jgi:hypothetical protein
MVVGLRGRPERAVHSITILRTITFKKMSSQCNPKVFPTSSQSANVARNPFLPILAERRQYVLRTVVLSEAKF